MRIIELLLFFSLPIYAFRSGGFQLADLIVVPFGVYLILRRPLTSSFWKSIGRDFAFLVLIVLILYSVINLTGHNALLHAPFTGLQIEYLYFGFLLYVFLLLGIRLFQQESPQKIVWNLLALIGAGAVAPLVVSVKVFLVKGFLFREHLTFNNPNQLAIFSGLCISILVLQYLIFYRYYTRRMMVCFLLILAAHTALLGFSTSRAGVFVLLNHAALLIHYMKTSRYGVRNVGVCLLIALPFGVAAVEKVMRSGVTQKFLILDRFTNQEQENVGEDVSSRALHVVSDINTPGPFYWGTGVITTKLENLEVHNDILSFIYQTGFVSAVLFLLACLGIMLNLVRQRPLHVLTFLPYLGFGLFHYTFRPRIVWVFFAFFIVMSK
ncbi:hypothetical protein EBR96_09285, partial [bacterium]|nr:hypothetical protein [bacterium]